MIIKKAARQSGKTTKLIHKLIENHNAILIVADENFRRHLLYEYMGIIGLYNRIFPIHKFSEVSRHSNRDTVVYIDEIGLCMERLLHLQVDEASHTDYPEQTWKSILIK